MGKVVLPFPENIGSLELQHLFTRMNHNRCYQISFKVLKYAYMVFRPGLGRRPRFGAYSDPPVF